VAERIGFVGVGKMGLPMSHRLLDAGYSLVIYDIVEAPLAELAERGAERVGSAAEVGDKAEVVFVSLPTPDIVEKVILGEGGVASGGKVRTVVDLSTTGPKTAMKIGEALARQGKMLVDSPVSGGVAGAKAGTLAVMVSGSLEAREPLLPMLKIIGKLFMVGDKPGLGQTMKLVNNLLSGTAMAISSEAIVMGVKAGLNPSVMCDVINAGSGRNSATQDKFPKCIIPRSFDYGFASGLMLKDVGLFMSEAEAMGLTLGTAGAVRDLWQRVVSELGGQSDFTEIVKVLEGPAGVEVKAPASPSAA
jgi:3-hydroxyisobutyrate dehydrogenase-like beta-hydroxyacid dehydrogenase